MKICEYVNIGRYVSVKVGPLITSFPLLSGDLLIFFNCYSKDVGKACILVKCRNCTINWYNLIASHFVFL